MRRSLMVACLVVATGLACRNGVAAQQQPSASTTAASTAEFDGLLAPVALYPDQLLAQMLLCAATPAKVVELNEWLSVNSDLKGTALQDAATVDGFEPSFVTMTMFPAVVKFMAEQLEWTTKLGKAFAANRDAVFDSIQRLRKNAHDKGTLQTTPQQEVTTKAVSSGEQVIVIEPANPQVVYVPTYNPQVVYTQPPPTTVVVQEDNDADAAVAGLIGFTAGIAIGAAIDNDYYYGPYGWRGGVYMYNDAWDDWYDAREDAREDWLDHREDLIEERGERGGERQEQRTERTEGRQQTRTESQAQRTDRQQTRQENGPSAQTRAAAAEGRTSSYESRGHSGAQQTARERSGTSSDAFSNYSSGRSERAASARGQSSRSSARGGGGRRR